MSSDTEARIREQICDVGRRLYARNLVAATDGNISVRLGEGRYLCTPSGVGKGDMAPEDLLIADDKGHKIEGRGRVTSEFMTHLAAYEVRSDVGAVVHAHPPKAVALSIAGISMAEPVLPEVVYSMGSILTAPYATPGTPEGAVAIRGIIARCDGLLMDQHGALTVGRDLKEAYHRLEKLEHAAEVLVTAHLLGGPRRLTPEQVAKLVALRAAYFAPIAPE